MISSSFTRNGTSRTASRSKATYEIFALKIKMQTCTNYLVMMAIHVWTVLSVTENLVECTCKPAIKDGFVFIYNLPMYIMETTYKEYIFMSLYCLLYTGLVVYYMATLS